MKDDMISRQAAQRLFGKALTYKEQQGKLTWTTVEVKQFAADFIEDLPSAQPELIEKTAYIRGFEQGRTQGMIDAQGGKK